MGDISRGADTLLTAVFGEHLKSPQLHAIINWNTRDHRNAARPLIHVIPVQILEYDHLVGAVNEGGFHWSLIVVQPKDNKVLYINPMGEQNVSQQQILQQWM
ncbi:hypothetical protein DPMN_116654 [Dreissena polymorpha]|uniref:Ubiquitin-like protease family profile domain-containing protein n=1 Tax=Dreissena polymorpha TaxID=45954 RepID=A0A9D4KQ84_DREPO|nr:hypothetical protein DPMN_116654 [Dreissena polymorpha]